MPQQPTNHQPTTNQPERQDSALTDTDLPSVTRRPEPPYTIREIPTTEQLQEIIKSDKLIVPITDVGHVDVFGVVSDKFHFPLDKPWEITLFSGEVITLPTSYPEDVNVEALRSVVAIYPCSACQTSNVRWIDTSKFEFVPSRLVYKGRDYLDYNPETGTTHHIQGWAQEYKEMLAEAKNSSSS
jgi:hypothetical protein